MFLLLLQIAVWERVASVASANCRLGTGVSSSAIANRRLGTGTSDGAIAGVDAIAVVDAVSARNHDQYPGGRDNALTDPMD